MASQSPPPPPTHRAMNAPQPVPAHLWHLLRYSLVFVWLATACASVWELHGQSQELLIRLDMPVPWAKPALILGGAALDLALGLWLWCRPSRTANGVALAAMLLLTLVATVVDASWWLHPLGPLTKNGPIAAILYVLAKTAPST